MKDWRPKLEAAPCQLTHRALRGKLFTDLNEGRLLLSSLTRSECLPPAPSPRRESWRYSLLKAAFCFDARKDKQHLENL
jgi:hypothetical protein